ncbi:MAG: flagellar basal body P-ring formation chaperone FlgA [Planctomycetota bacterium]
MSYVPFLRRAVICIGTFILMVIPSFGQYAEKNGIEVASVSSKTRWGFRVVASATVSSPIVRLGDVAIPLDPNMAGWQRLSRLSIGLVPLDGHPMRIERRRLAEILRNAEATANTIEWLGPEKIVVEYKRSSKPGQSVATAAYSPQRDPVSTILQSPQVSQPSQRSVPALPSASVPSVAAMQPRDALTDVEARRVEQWVLRGVSLFMPGIKDDYTIEIDRTQPELAKLKTLAAVTNVQPLAALQEGTVPFKVSAQGISEPLTARVELTLTAHPSVVVARSSIARGQVIQERDLDWQVIPTDRMRPEYATDMSQVVGKEARSSLSANRPIFVDRLGAPLLIRRGDLIEVQVVGGGITVTTNGKALRDGSASELIEIETQNPRKRLVGRVVQSGLVEIVTRAPTTR